MGNGIAFSIRNIRQKKRIFKSQFEKVKRNVQPQHRFPEGGILQCQLFTVGVRIWFRVNCRGQLFGVRANLSSEIE